MSEVNGMKCDGTGAWCGSPGCCPKVASPVQGAASASGEAKGAAVKPWQERARERWPDFPAEQLGQWAATECKDAEIADWRALAKRAQAAQPSGAVAGYKPGSWFDAHTLDEMQEFYLSRLPAIREAAKEHGYAIGLHGSQRRDLDLMAMQWRDGASDKDTLAHAIAVAACGLTRDGAFQWEAKPSGRFAVSLPICWTDHSNPDFDKPSMGHIDLSVIERAPSSMHAAADYIDAKAQQYIDENAETEHDTGAVVFRYGEAGREYYSSLVELAEELRLATPAPEQEAAQVDQEAVAWAVTAPRGGIHKLSITRESAERKATKWREEWPDNGCSVRPLVFGDAAPVAQEAEQPQGDVMRPFGAPAGQHEVTRLDLLSLIHSQMHRVYASAIDREEVDTKYMVQIEEALRAVYARAELASGSREGRDGCSESGNLGAANTNKGGDA